MVEFPPDGSPADMDSPGPTPSERPPHPQSSAKRASSLLSNPWRFFRERSEARARRREEAELAGIRREQRRAERAERERRAVLSGALGCYPLSRAVLASEGRVLTDLNRNARLIDGDAASIRPGDVVVSSMMEDAGFLAPLDDDDDDDDDDDEARRVGSDDDHLSDDLNTRTAGDAPSATRSRPTRRRGRRSGRAPAPRYTHEPRVYFVLRGRVDVLAPGPGPDKKDPSDGEDELLNGSSETGVSETGRRSSKRREGRDANVRRREWHRAVGLGPGACFSAPLQAMHGPQCPGGARAVAGGKGLRLLTVPMSIVRRNGAAAVMETCRRETMELIRTVPWLAWIEPAWVTGFVIDSFVLERRGDPPDARYIPVNADGSSGASPSGLDVPLVRAGEALRTMRVVTEGAVTGAGNGGVVAAGGVFHEISLADAHVVFTDGDGKNGDGKNGDGDGKNGDGKNGDGENGDGDGVSAGRLSSRGWTAVTDAVARIAPTECIAMRLDRLREHAARSAYVARSLERHEKARALRASLFDRVDRSDAAARPDEVITDEDLVAMGILADPDADGDAPWRAGACPVGTPGGPVPDPSSAPRGSVRREKIRSALKDSLAFEGAEYATLDKAIAEMRELSLRRGDLLAEEGGECWGLCVLERGELSLYRSRADPHRDRSATGVYHELVGRVGRGYVAGEIPTMFNTPNDATVVAAGTADETSTSTTGGGETRLWGLSRAQCERLWGTRDERWRLKENARFAPFPRELPAFRAMERARLEHQKRALERAKAGLPPLARTASNAELCLRALPHGLGGTLLESVISRASPVHRLEAWRVNEAIERTNAFIEDVRVAREAREERDRIQRERMQRRAERDAEVAASGGE